MPENGRSEREAQGFQEPRTSGGGMGVLAVVSTIAVAVAAVWVMRPDARSGSKAISSPSSAPSPSPTELGVAEDERTIYLWDTASGEMRELATGQALSDPELSPDGELVAYEREDADGLAQIYLLDADGADHRLTNFPGGASDPTWSPDGRIAFAATLADVVGPGAGTDIFVMDADGSDVRRLAGTVYDDAEPDWSPDGSRIAFHNTSDDGPDTIWVASIETDSNRRLTSFHDTWSAMDPAWSPDGRWIAYSRYNPGNTLNGKLYSAELWLASPDGFERRRIGSPGTSASWNSGTISSKPSWSPDGRLIVYEQNDWDGGQRRVKVINAETRLARPFLSSTPGGWWVDFDPSWGSGGILYVRPSADPILERPSIPKGFGTASGLGGPGIDATITMTESRCELSGSRRRIFPGSVKLDLINDSRFEAHFTLWRLSGTLYDLWTAHGHDIRLQGPRVASLDPSSAEVWSSRDPMYVGSWAVICHKDLLRGANGSSIRPVGVAGPIIVG